MFQLKFFFIFLLAFCQLTFAAEKTSSQGTLKKLIYCLVQEEAALHKRKVLGPNYHLNQVLINRLMRLNFEYVSAPYYQNVCNSTSFDPALKLLEALLMNEVNFFKVKPKHQDQSGDFIYQQNYSQIEDLVEDAIELFNLYVSQLEVYFNDPACFYKSIPEISQIRNEFLYLEEQYGPLRIIQDKKRLHKIFSQLKRLDEMIKLCNQPKPPAKEDPAATPPVTPPVP